MSAFHLRVCNTASRMWREVLVFDPNWGEAYRLTRPIADRNMFPLHVYAVKTRCREVAAVWTAAALLLSMVQYMELHRCRNHSILRLIAECGASNWCAALAGGSSIVEPQEVWRARHS